MKKAAVLLLMVICSTIIFAQSESSNKWKIGGSVGLMWYESIGVNFAFSPEITYDFNDKWGVGGGINFNIIGNNYTSDYLVLLAPYARYTPLRINNFSLFLDMGFAMGGRNDLFVASVGVSPGIQIDINKRFSLLANFGFLGYSYGINGLEYGPGMHSVGFSANPNNLTIGAYVRF